MALPSYVALKSKYNNQYLSYLKEDGKVQGFLQFSGPLVASPYVKYAVEPATSGNGLVHMRCCYNNKYWVRESNSSLWLVAAADAPEEDQSKATCTLFEPMFLDDQHETVRFRHVQTQRYAYLWRAAEPFYACFYLASASTSTDGFDVCIVFNWRTLLVLPEYLAFKGHNDNFLKGVWIENHEYLQFSGGSDIGDPSVGHVVTNTVDGNVRITSRYFGKYWRRSPNWIWADSTDTTTDNPDTLFWPVKVDDNVIALRNLGNNNLCKGLTTEGKTVCLNAAISSIDEWSRLEVSELVLQRSIYDVNFRLADSRIYNETVLTMATASSANGSQEPNTITLKLSYTNSQSRTWNSSVSAKVSASIEFGTGIPLIFEGKVTLSGEFSGTYQWGSTKTTTSVLEADYQVTVPSMTAVTVTLLATQGTCDVPFSYTQHDTLTTGQQVTSNFDDGVYTGINCYNFRYEVTQQPL